MSTPLYHLHVPASYLLSSLHWTQTCKLILFITLQSISDPFLIVMSLQDENLLFKSVFMTQIVFIEGLCPCHMENVEVSKRGSPPINLQSS